MPASIAKTHSELRIIGAITLVAAMFLSSIAALMAVSKQELNRGLRQINQAELTEMARQIALTLDASINPQALADPAKMQQIVDRNMAARREHTIDNLLLEIRVHAPDPTSSVGYRAIAASTPALIGQESDPEDIEAIRNGKLVILAENRDGTTILDITCPLHSNGVPFGTAGIKMSMQQGFALITAISASTVRALELTAVLTVTLAGIISIVVAVFLLRSNSIRRQLVKTLQEQATTDELTGLINRRKFMETAQAELKRAARFHHPLTVALLDIDRFKQVNDVRGHSAGDKALVAIAKILLDNIRETDVAARLGGDEFILIFPETRGHSAFEVLERCRQAVAELSIDLGTATLTISVGIASLKNKESLETLIERADRALYKAKDNGRNRVIVEEQ